MLGRSRRAIRKSKAHARSQRTVLGCGVSRADGGCLHDSHVAPEAAHEVDGGAGGSGGDWSGSVSEWAATVDTAWWMEEGEDVDDFITSLLATDYPLLYPYVEVPGVPLPYVPTSTLEWHGMTLRSLSTASQQQRETLRSTCVYLAGKVHAPTDADKDQLRACIEYVVPALISVIQNGRTTEDQLREEVSAVTQARDTAIQGLAAAEMRAAELERQLSDATLVRSVASRHALAAF